MKYTGPLSRPITKPHISPFHTGDEVAEKVRSMVAARAQKLPLLFKAHGVADGDLFGLVLKLAEAHVPGFRFAERAGRKTKWTPFDKAELRVDTDAVRKATSKTLDACLREVVKGERWRERTQGMKPPALRQHYYAAHPGIVSIVEGARKFDALPADVRRAAEEGRMSDAWALLDGKESGE